LVKKTLSNIFEYLFQIFLGIPNISQRKEILDVLTEKMNLALDVKTFHLAEATPGFVGADLVLLCQAAFHCTLRESPDKQVSVIRGNLCHPCYQQIHNSVTN